MDKFSKYLVDKKVEYIYRFSKDIKKEFDIDIKLGTGFKNIQFHYSAPVDGKLYVHKDALRFVYTNADTYLEDSREIQTYKFCTDSKVIDEYNARIKTIFEFIRSGFGGSSLFPKVLDESQSFFVLENNDEDLWEPVFRLRKEDKVELLMEFESLYKKKKMIVSPFKSELSGEIFRHKDTGKLKIFDMRKLKIHANDFFVIYFNDWGTINNLYILQTSIFTFKKTLLKAYEADFDTESTVLVKL